MVVTIKEDKHKRTFEQINIQYEAEKELADKLLNSTSDERKTLYTSLYDEYYKIAPFAPELKYKNDPEAVAWIVEQRMQLLRGLLQPDLIYLEVGPGDCSLSREVAKYVKKVYAVDVSNEVTKNSNLFPSNFELVISDGCTIPIAENTVNLAYSHQLMEHLHPDDAFEQLQNIYKALAPGGMYVCITPNRLSGPHDSSQYFDEIATGYHLKEYTVTELYKLFRQVGFSQVSLYKSYKKNHIKIPLFLVTVPLFKLCETFLSLLPFSLRRKIASTPMLFRGMTIVGRK